MQIRQFILLATLACLGGLAVRLLGEDNEINWLESYAEARQEAERTGKPIFLEFRCEP
jgi:hypothetical protein